MTPSREHKFGLLTLRKNSDRHVAVEHQRMSFLPGETMRSAIHRCLAILLVFYICVLPQMLRLQESHVAGELLFLQP